MPKIVQCKTAPIEHNCKGTRETEFEISIGEYEERPTALRYIASRYKWRMRDKLNFAQEIEIRFCPFCGKDLKKSLMKRFKSNLG